MNKKITILIVGLLFLILPVFVLSQTSLDKPEVSSNTEKCSAKIEGLKLCAESSSITIDSGKPITIKLIWSNSSDVDRHIVRSGYGVKIVDGKGEKLIPVFQQRQMEMNKRMETSGDDTPTEEELKEIKRTMRGGSDRGIDIDANQITNDIVRPTAIEHDYDLTKKGKYFVTINKTFWSSETSKTIQVVINDIEIIVK